jgi:hypothetical protein
VRIVEVEKCKHDQPERDEQRGQAGIAIGACNHLRCDCDLKVEPDPVGQAKGCSQRQRVGQHQPGYKEAALDAERVWTQLRTGDNPSRAVDRSRLESHADTPVERGHARSGRTRRM